MGSLSGSKINYLVYSQLNIVKEIGDYLLVYDTNHKREELLFISDNLEDAKKMYQLGWKKKKILSGIVFMAPEIWIIDLSDPFKVMENNNPKENLALYKTLERFKKNKKIFDLINKILRKNEFKNLKVYFLNGQSLETEIRMAGTDKRVSDFKFIFIEALKSTRQFIKEIKKIENVYSQQSRQFKLIKKPLSISKLKKYHNIFNYYKYIDRDFKFPNNIYGIFKLFPKVDYIILVPQSGFKFLDEVSGIFSLKNILFYERHFSRDGNFWLFKKDFHNKKVLIIDTSYSGETLNSIADMVYYEGGSPIRIAVWPKSKLGVINSEYVIFLDKMIKTREIDINDQNLFINLYEKIIFN